MIVQHKNESRKVYLFRVATDYISNYPDLAIDYDGTTCDGWCLLQEMEDEISDQADEEISQLFKKYWSGELQNGSIKDQVAQLRKTLKNQLEGFWSGSSAYSIVIEGGFLVDAKFGGGKTLTEKGKAFIDDTRYWSNDEDFINYKGDSYNE